MVSCEFAKAEKFFNYGYIVGTSIRPHIILLTIICTYTVKCAGGG